MKKIGLVIGYGSIGKKHYRAMKKLNFFKKIYILMSEYFNGENVIKSIKEIKKLIQILLLFVQKHINTIFN